jgi:hypothetical protein
MWKTMVSMVAFGSLSYGTVAAEIGHIGTVSRLVIQPGTWGGCAVRMVPDPSTVAGLESCLAHYVSLDCDATSGQSTKAQALNKLSNAQLAYAASMRYYVKVNPDIKLNGVCFAVRSDVLPPL